MHVARRGNRKSTEFWSGEPREGYHCEDVGLDMKTLLKWIFNKRDGEAWTGLL